MPKLGPSDASRMQTIAFLPIRLSPSPRPTVVVVLPSPAGVGLMAVTRMSLPSLLFWIDLMNSAETFALSWPYGTSWSAGIPSLAPISRIGFFFAARAIAISDLNSAMKALPFRSTERGATAPMVGHTSASDRCRAILKQAHNARKATVPSATDRGLNAVQPDSIEPGEG